MGFSRFWQDAADNNVKVTINENHFVNFTGATFALATHVYTLACILKVVYINKFVARHENLFYRKYSLEKKKRLITDVKRENDICLRTHFDNRITPRLS